MSGPRLTIGLAMRNSAPTIDAAIRSILAQRFERWELVVLDDGSSDASVARVRGYADPRITVRVDGARRGLAARMNEAIELARGELFARMDADDIAYPERFERQIAYLDAHPNVDLLGAGMMIFDDAGTPIGLHPVAQEHAQITRRPWRGFHLPHPTWMGRSAWFRRMRYDTRYRKAQDQELLRRSWRISRFAALGEPLVGYRQDRLSVRKSWQSRYYVGRSLIASDGMRGAVLGVPLQIALALVDTFAIGSGLGRRVLRHRVAPASPEQIARWREVWSAVTTEHTPCAA